MGISPWVRNKKGTWEWEPDLEDGDHNVGKLFSSELVCRVGPSFMGEGAQDAGAPSFSWGCRRVGGWWQDGSLLSWASQL